MARHGLFEVSEGTSLSVRVWKRYLVALLSVVVSKRYLVECH